MTINICGNSHIGALLKAHTDQPTSFEQVVFLPFGTGRNLAQPFCEVIDGQLRISSGKYRENFKRITGSEYFTPTSRWAVLLANPLAVVRRKYWRHNAPSVFHQKNKRPIPMDVIDAIFESQFKATFDFYTEMLNVGLDVTAIACPNIRRDHPLFEHKYALTETQAQELEQIGNKVYEKFLKDSGISYISPPASTIDQDGFLLDRYAQKLTRSGERDPHHANAAYGALMLEKVINEMASPSSHPANAHSADLSAFS